MSDKPFLPKIDPKRLSGSEQFIGTGHKPDFTVQQFWEWAFSDLMSNATRGVLAEFIVAKALGININNSVREEWAMYDLETRDGIKIEVKSSAYLQSWWQRRYSTIQFGIAPTIGWYDELDKYDDKPIRHADVYIFCLLNHKCKKTVNPLDLDQWEFYVVPTETLDRECPGWKTIGIKKLCKLAGKAVGWRGLRESHIFINE